MSVGAASIPRAGAVAARSQASRRPVLWIGGARGLELGIARDAMGGICDVIDVATPLEAAGLAAAGGTRSPAFAVLATDRPGRFSLGDAVLVACAWPLAPVVSVASTLADGRRRSGPPLPGVEEVPWHDLPSRARWWLSALDAGVPTSLGVPTTARREERVVDAVGPGRHGGVPAVTRPRRVAVAAGAADAAEGLADLIARAGHSVAARFTGRPPVDLEADALVWDAGDLAADRVEWLRLLAANRPGLSIVVVDGFPRGDAVRDALGAGATAVLGRPVPLEPLLGALLPPEVRG